VPREEPGRHVVSISLPDDVYWQLKQMQVNFSQLFNELLDHYLAGYDDSAVRTKARIRVLQDELREIRTTEVVKVQELTSLKRHLETLEKKAVTKQQTMDDLFRIFPQVQDFQAQRPEIKEFWLERLQLVSEEAVIELYISRNKVLQEATLQSRG